MKAGIKSTARHRRKETFTPDKDQVLAEHFFEA
jgi:hypothetical protein